MNTYKTVLIELCLVFMVGCAHNKSNQRVEYVGTCNNVLYMSQEAMIEAKDDINNGNDLELNFLYGMEIEFLNDHKCLSRFEVLFVTRVYMVFNGENGQKLCSIADWLVYSKLEGDDILYEIIEEYNEESFLCDEKEEKGETIKT